MSGFKTAVLATLLAATGVATAGSVVDLGSGIVTSGHTLTLPYEGHLSPGYAYSMDCVLDNFYSSDYPLTIGEWNWDPATWDVTLDGKDSSGNVVLTPGMHTFHVWRFSIEEKNIYFTNYRQSGKESAAVEVSCKATQQS